MGLPKTVFEVNLGVFGKAESSQKMMFLFVIRDHIGATPLDNLSATLQVDMQKIWDALVKTEVRRGVLVVVMRITSPGPCALALVSPAVDLRLHGTICGPFICSCNEIAAVALSESDTESKSTRQRIESDNVVEGLGGMMGTWKGNALTHFDRGASWYHTGVYQRKCADLLLQLDTKLRPFLGPVKNLHKTCLNGSLEEVKIEGYSFADVVGGAREKGPTSRDGWAYDDELSSLQQRFGVVADQLKADEAKKMINSVEEESLPLDFNRRLGFNTTEEENEPCLAPLCRRAWLAYRAKVDEQTSDNVLIDILRTHFEERSSYDAGTPAIESQLSFPDTNEM
ncbi:unnamed protein product [Rhizoctonia solani]|uniref:Sey1/RHD3-like three-helix bundle domain-containing protein n=1 Tax=Rhizoctonia solani TaxID=456999 RepID=A0A8H3HB01_9AGAM|nr:unnamed protein product [Rhizoctonia solani]